MGIPPSLQALVPGSVENNAFTFGWTESRLAIMKFHPTVDARVVATFTRLDVGWEPPPLKEWATRVFEAGILPRIAGRTWITPSDVSTSEVLSTRGVRGGLPWTSAFGPVEGTRSSSFILWASRLQAVLEQDVGFYVETLFHIFEGTG